MIEYIFKYIFIILKMLANIKSKLIINKIFASLRNKIKLIIIKYTKLLLNKLNITKKDFNIYQKLEDFNFKYGTKLKDIEIKDLNLDGKTIGYKGLKDLCEINFKGVYILSLCRAQITDINSLKYLNLEDLKILELKYNSIYDISVFAKN